MPDGDDGANQLQAGTEVEWQAHAPVTGRQVRHHAQQGRADGWRNDGHQAVQRAHRAHRAALFGGRRGTGDQALHGGGHGGAKQVAEDDRETDVVLR